MSSIREFEFVRLKNLRRKTILNGLSLKSNNFSSTRSFSNQWKVRNWRRGEIELELEEVRFIVNDAITERVPIRTCRIFQAAEYNDKSRSVLSLVAPDTDILIEFDDNHKMLEWLERIKSAKRQFQGNTSNLTCLINLAVNEMRQSVANVQHTIEAQLMPMITARQSVIEQGFDIWWAFSAKVLFWLQFKNLLRSVQTSDRTPYCVW